MIKKKAAKPTKFKAPRTLEISHFKIYYDQLTPGQKLELRQNMGICQDTLYRIFKDPMRMTLNQATTVVQYMSTTLKDAEFISLEELCKVVRMERVS